MNALEIIALRDKLSLDQQHWAKLWRDTARFCMLDVGVRTAGFTKLTGVAYSTPTVQSTVTSQALDTLASGMRQWIFPGPHSDWFQWQAQPGMSKAVMRWLNDCTQRAQGPIEESGFYDEMHSSCIDLACYGTAGFSILPGEDKAVRCQALPPTDFVFERDFDGAVARVIMSYDKKPAELISVFGNGAVPAEVRMDADLNPTQTHEVLHCLYKRSKGELPGEGESYHDDPKAKLVGSCWVHVGTRTVLRVGGFDEMPFFVPRWERFSGSNLWGVSPAMKAMAAIKNLDLYEEIMKVLGRLSVEPRIKRQTSATGNVALKPGGVSQVGDMDEFKEWGTGGQYEIGLKLLEREEKKIQELFHTRLFQNLAQIEREMTRFEVSARMEENANRIAPAISRLGREGIAPEMQVFFMHLLRTGVFAPPPPDAFFKGMFVLPKVVQTNRMSRALNARKEAVFGKVLERVTAVAQFDPNVMDLYNWESIFEDLDLADGIPTEWHNDEEKRAMIRDARAAQAQQAAVQEAMLKAAGSKPAEVAGLVAEGGLV